MQQLKLMQQQSDADLFTTQLQLQLLLNTDSLILPQYESLKRQTLSLSDSTIVSSHPQLAYSRLLQQATAAQTETERSKLLPDFWNTSERTLNGACVRRKFAHWDQAVHFIH